MVIEKQRKPGPKSSKQSQIALRRGTLGETSGSFSDDSSEEYTDDSHAKGSLLAESRRSNRFQVNANASEFCTPEAAKDATDYGLDFTTSQIRNPSPRRCSTLRTAHESTQESQQSAVQETETPISSRSTKPTKPTKSKTASSETQAPALVTTKPAKKSRKQRNPIQLEKRFWTEVRNLQCRTDNLIPKMPFARLVREIMIDASVDVTKITRTAMEALQASAEMYLTQRLQDAYMLTLHRGRVTLDVRDMQMINYFKINL